MATVKLREGSSAALVNTVCTRHVICSTGSESNWPMPDESRPTKKLFCLCGLFPSTVHRGHSNTQQPTWQDDPRTAILWISNLVWLGWEAFLCLVLTLSLANNHDKPWSAWMSSTTEKNHITSDWENHAILTFFNCIQHYESKFRGMKQWRLWWLK